MGAITKRELKLLLEKPPQIPQGLEEHDIKLKIKEPKLKESILTVPKVVKQKISERLLSKKRQELTKQEPAMLERIDNKIKSASLNLDVREKELASKRNELDKVKSLLEEKEQLLNQKEKELSEKEAQIMSSNKELSRDIYQWNKKKTAIEEEMFQSEKRKQIILNLEKDWHLKKGGVEEDKRTLSKRESEINQNYYEITNYRKELEIKEAEINSKLKEMEESRTILLAEESKVKDKLIQLKEKNELFNENMIKLIEIKKQTELDLAKGLKEIEGAKKEWKSLSEILDENVGYIKEIDTRIPSIIQELQDDVQLITKKEKEVFEGVAQLEKDRELLEREQDKILRKVEQLESLDSQLKEKEKELAVREAKVAKARELKENIAYIEKSLVDIKKKYGEEQERLNKLIEEGTAKMTYLKNRELELTRKETEVKLKEQWLLDKENELKNERMLLEKEGLHKFVERQREERVMYPEAYPEAEASKNVDITILINKTRELIREGRLEEAKRQITHVQGLYSKLRNEDEDKRKINYEIIELQTDIKLAALQ